MTDAEFEAQPRASDADHLDHEERVASTLTKAILWLRDALTTNDVTE